MVASRNDVESPAMSIATSPYAKAMMTSGGARSSTRCETPLRAVAAQPINVSNAACSSAIHAWPVTCSTNPDTTRYAAAQHAVAIPRRRPSRRCAAHARGVTLAGVSVEIIPVASSRELRQFIDVPWRIYNATDHPQWVPPLRIAVRDALDTKANPFYKQADRQLFLALRDGSIVGRIAAI